MDKIEESSIDDDELKVKVKKNLKSKFASFMDINGDFGEKVKEYKENLGGT